jgi:hypothetical protein
MVLQNQFTQLNALYASLQAQYNLLNNEHEGLKKLVANSQPVPVTLAPESILPAEVPQVTS